MSNMVVATNVTALNSHRNLKMVGSRQSTASQRLSSGYRINSAADDAAGLAISEKMRAQIRGLDQASTNAQDAISLVQTAEGGMQEIDNMIQRIRELVVQAANDTNDYDTEDRQKIQDEINQLLAEIDSMSERVEFNQKKVINGQYEGTVTDTAVQTAYDNAAQTRDAAKTALDTGLQAIKTAKTDVAAAELALTQAVTAGLQDLVAVDLDALYNSIDTFYRAKVGTNAADLAESAYDTLMADVKTELDSVRAIISAVQDIEGASDLTGVNGLITSAVTSLGNMVTRLTSGVKANDGTTDITDSQLVTDFGNLKDEATGTGKALGQALGTGGGIADAADDVDTEKQTLAAAEQALPALQTTYETELAAYRTAWKAFINAEREGGLYFQVGANSEQGIYVQIGSVDTATLGIGNGNEAGAGTPTVIDVLKESGDEITGLLDTLDDALSYITTQRSKLGAVQNRLEYTINSLDISSENLSAAESRIRDTDMAKEMMNLTQTNVLQQAATSMLAQANSAPQSILQLLS